MTDLVARTSKLSEIAATLDLVSLVDALGPDPITAYDFAERVMNENGLSYESSIGVVQELIDHGRLRLTDYYSVELPAPA